MAKFCQNCGSALSEGTKFCPSCGAHVLQSARPAQPQQPQQPLYQQTQPQQPQRQYTQSQVYIPEQFARRNAARAQLNNPRPQQSVPSVQQNYAKPQQSIPGVQQNYARPQQSAPVPPQSTVPVAPKKGKGGIILLAMLFVAALGTVGFFGFRDGGWFRGLGKQTAEVTALNPSLSSEVTVKQTKTPEGLGDDDKFEAMGQWYDIGSEDYDGLPLSGDVLLTVSIPGKPDKKDIGSYVFVYYDDKNEEYRYLFPDSYDLSAGTMTIDLPHFSLWGTAKLTKEEQIDAFLNSYSMKLAVERGKRQQAAAELEPYVRAKVEAMGLTKEAAADLIQSTVNFLGTRFTGDNSDYIEMGTKYVTTLTRGFYDGDGEAALSGLEDAVTDALMNSWDSLEFSDRLDEVLGSEFAGGSVSTLLSNSSGIARMAGYMAGGDMKAAMKELGNIMQGVHPAVEIGTKAVAFLGAMVNEEFTYWKSNQIEELYQIYKNGAEDIWGNEVIAGNRESFLTYLNTSSGFTMAKGIKRFYNLDKIGEICEKYDWPYSSYEELPDRYRDIFEQRAENGLMEYFELRLQQEKSAAQIKATERICIETMMTPTIGILNSGSFGEFFGEKSPDDFDLTSRLERLVNVRRFVSQYVDEDELARTTKAGSFNYGDILNWWVRLASENKRTEAIMKFREELREHDLLKTFGGKKITGLIYEKVLDSDGMSRPVWNYSEYNVTVLMEKTVRGQDETEWVPVDSPRGTEAQPDYRAKMSGLMRQLAIPVAEDGTLSYEGDGWVVEGEFDPVTKTGLGKITLNMTYAVDYGKEEEIRGMVESGMFPQVLPPVYYDITLSLSFDLTIKQNPDGAGVLLVLNGGGTCSYAGEVLDHISGIKLKDDNSVCKAETGLEITTRPLYASYPITYENVTYLYYFE